MTLPTKAPVALITILIATAGLAAADHEVPPDPFAQEDPLFTDEDDEEAFQDLLNDAPETIPEAGDALESDDEDEEDAPPPAPEEDTNDAPAPGALTLLALLGLTAAARRG